MKVETRVFGKTNDGREVHSFILRNKNGMEAEFIDYGATLVKLIVPERNGKRKDIVLGYDDVAGYENNSAYFGGFIGRCCNRIEDGKFSINGIDYQLERNDNGVNCLHGGEIGYNNKMYEAETFEEENGCSVEFFRMSHDLEQGFPGNLDITVTYTMTEENELVIEYSATPDRDTIVNFTNHSYFNLQGHDTGDILNQKIKINADYFTEINDKLVPTGRLIPVKDTPMDFREWKKIGKDINSVYDAIVKAGGYDHNYAVGQRDGVTLIAEAKDEMSNRRMEVYSDMPGVQFYTGNFIHETRKGKDGCIYKEHSGFCLETQKFPNAINISEFDTPIVKKGHVFDSITIYKFYW